MGLKILVDLKSEMHAKKTCIFVLGAVCSGKTTLAHSLCNFFGLNVYAIDDFRKNYSNGSKKGEDYAYQQFVLSVNQARCLDPVVVECTGLSKNFFNIDTRNSIKIFLECSEKILRERNEQRVKMGYRHPPFPYDFDRFSSTEKIFDERLLSKLSNISKINSEINSSEKVFSQAIIHIYNEIDNIFPQKQKKI